MYVLKSKLSREDILRLLSYLTVIKVLCVIGFQATVVTIATPSYCPLFQTMSFFSKSSQKLQNETFKFCGTHVSLAANKDPRKFFKRLNNFSSNSKIIF